MKKIENLCIEGRIMISIQEFKEKCVCGQLLQKSKYVLKHKKQKIAKKIDKYIGWLARWMWSKRVKVSENKILFLTFNKQYTCNPKYICQELIKKNIDCDIVWLVNSEKSFSHSPFPARIRRVQIGTAKAFYELLTAKIIIENAYLSQEMGYTPIQKEQYLIQTWHGSLGIKRFGPEYDSIKSRVLAAKRAGNYTDLFLSNSTFETKEVASVFWENAEIREWGHARNDLLICQRYNIKQEVRIRLGIPVNFRIALYAPTYRDEKSRDHYQLNYNKLIEALSKRFGGEWIVLIKLHYSMRNYTLNLKTNPYIKDVSKYSDIQELMLITDVGITDYSSWIFDFLLTGKPAFIYADDIYLYEDERGFYYPLNTTPFPIAQTSDELQRNIINFDLQNYEHQAKEFLQEKGCIEDGLAAHRVVDKITQLLGKVEG